MINALARYSANHELIRYLTEHTLKQLYRDLWIWSEDNSIMRRGKSWCTSKEDCTKEGKRNGPSYTSFDGPGAPSALLCMESVCPCFVHQIFHEAELITKPCQCFTPNIPEHYKDLSELEIM